MWVFDAIPEYFNLYRFAGAAVLRDLTIENPPRLVSPCKRDIQMRKTSLEKAYFYNNERISRNVRTPIPYNNGDGPVKFRMEDVPFLDGLVDMHRLEKGIKNSPALPSLKNYKGFSTEDKMKLRTGLAISAKRAYEDRSINESLIKKIGINKWEFNHIGL